MTYFCQPKAHMSVAAEVHFVRFQNSLSSPMQFRMLGTPGREQSPALVGFLFVTGIRNGFLSILCPIKHIRVRAPGVEYCIKIHKYHFPQAQPGSNKNKPVFLFSFTGSGGAVSSTRKLAMRNPEQPSSLASSPHRPPHPPSESPQKFRYKC